MSHEKRSVWRWALIGLLVFVAGYPLAWIVAMKLVMSGILPNWISDLFVLAFIPMDWLLQNGPQPLRTLLLWIVFHFIN